MRINKSRRQAVQASYSPALLDSLIEQYSDQYSYDTHETIWETIYEQYKDSGLADDVLAALEDQDDDEYFDEEYYDGFADDLFCSSEKYDAAMTGGVFAAESEVDWYDMSWPDQIKYMKNYVRKYKGTRVFEDFADHIGVDVMDIIDSFTDAEAHGDIKIPQSKQKDSEFANDDIYASEDTEESNDIHDIIQHMRDTIQEKMFNKSERHEFLKSYLGSELGYDNSDTLNTISKIEDILSDPQTLAYHKLFLGDESVLNKYPELSAVSASNISKNNPKTYVYQLLDNVGLSRDVYTSVSKDKETYIMYLYVATDEEDDIRDALKEAADSLGLSIRFIGKGKQISDDEVEVKVRVPRMQSQKEKNSTYGVQRDVKLRELVSQYNVLPVKGQLSTSVTMGRIFDGYARSNGLIYSKDFICPAFRENVIIKLTDKQIPEFVTSATDVDNYEEEIQEIGQEFTSENTSINSGKLPAVFKMVNFEPGTVNIDYGGGRFDNVAEYLKDFDVINLVYDPYNRSKEHNQDVIRLVREHGGADTATCSNVLNVIKEPEVRLNVLSNIKKLVKPSGTVYITVYEGSGKGNEGPTKSGYQLNRKTADYIEEIQQVFPDATRKGKLIVAHPNGGGSVTSSTNVDSDTDLGAQIQDEGNQIVRKYLMDTFGYQEVETYDIGQVSCFDPEDGTVEVSLNLYNMEEVDDTQMHELINLLDKMILQYDSNASFELDLQMPGYAEAIVNVNDSINSSESIEAVEDPRLDPPEYDEPNELPDMEEVAEVDLDAVIIIDENGSWDYEDTSYAWAAASDDEADLYSDEYPDIMLSDHVGVVEKVDDLMITLLPEVPGRYRVQGKAELVFDISGVESSTSNGYWDDLHGLEYDEEIYTDSAVASFNQGKSSIRDFKCTLIKSNIDVESSTEVLASGWSFGEQKQSAAGKYTTYCVIKKDGPGYIRYAFRDNGLTDLQHIQNEYTFQLSKLSSYDDADYVWCYYKDGAIIYVKSGKRIDTEFPAPYPEDYETFQEFIDDIVIQALETLEYYNSKIKSVMVHN